MVTAMTSAHALIDDLRGWVTTCGIPRKRLARMAGLAAGALWSCDTEAWNPRADTLRKLDELRRRLAAGSSASAPDARAA